MNTNLTSLTFLTALALSPAAFADDYTTFHVCQDQRIIHTSDGAEAGHVEYIVVDPSSHRIVSSVLTGGVVGEKFVAVPFESMQFNAEHEIMLTEITRERITSAPVIERTQITSSTNVIAPDIIQRNYQHFGLRFDTNVNVREGDRRDVSNRDNDRRDLNVRDGEHRDDNRRDARVDGRFTADGNRDARDHEASRDRDRNDTAEKNRDDRNRDGSREKMNGSEQTAARARAGSDVKNRNDRKSDPAAPPAGRAVAEGDQEHRDTSKQNTTDHAAKDQAAREVNKNKADEDNKAEAVKKAQQKDPAAPPAGRVTPEGTPEQGSGRPLNNKMEKSQPANNAKGEGEKPKSQAGSEKSQAETPRTTVAEKPSRSTTEEKPSSTRNSNQEKAENHSEKPSSTKAAHENGKSDNEERKNPSAN